MTPIPPALPDEVGDGWNNALNKAIDECWRLEREGKDDHRNSWMGNAVNALEALKRPPQKGST